MKTKATLTAFLVIMFFSCQKRNSSADIQLSGKNFTFNAGGDSVLITTKGKRWGFAYAQLDSTFIHIPSNMAFCDYVFSDSSFQIERRSCDTMIVRMNENNTNNSRVLDICLQAGFDYFDVVRITQAKR